MPKVTKTTKSPKKASVLEDDEVKTDVENTEATDTNENGSDTVDEGAGDTGETVAPAPKKAEATGSAKANVQAQMKSDVEATRVALSKEEQVHFMIPLAQGEKAGAFEDIWINGFHTRVPKGVMSIIPKSIADLLANKYAVEATAGQEFRLDLNPEKHDKVS